MGVHSLGAVGLLVLCWWAEHGYWECQTLLALALVAAPRPRPQSLLASLLGHERQRPGSCPSFAPQQWAGGAAGVPLNTGHSQPLGHPPGAMAGPWAATLSRCAGRGHGMASPRAPRRWGLRVPICPWQGVGQGLDAVSGRQV